MWMCAVNASGQEDYAKLDLLVGDIPKIISDKQQRIAVLSEGEKGYGLNARLFREYMSFKYDSAFKYIDENLRLAQEGGDHERIYDCRLKYAHILSVAGLFKEAGDVMGAICPDSASDGIKTVYYSQKADLFLYSMEFNDKMPHYNSLQDSMLYYRKKTMETASESSYDYAFAAAAIRAAQDDYKSAKAILHDYLAAGVPDTRTYSVVVSTLAFYYEMDGDIDNAEHYYRLSAENDLENAIIENSSLRHLADILFAKGDSQRAFKYLMACSECANFFGSRLRSVQNAAIFNKITDAYETQRKQIHQTTLIFLAVLLIVAAALVWLSIKLSKKNKSYIAANRKIVEFNAELDSAMEQLKKTNASLKESNGIKDEYIGRFMTLSSQIIENISQKHSAINKLAREKRMAELYAEIKNEDIITINTKSFYKNFDEAFLNLFPTFCAEVNALLKPDCQIEIRDGSLNTEFRVLALLRLGFADNKQIASILRSSIATIYTYRSKIRAKALDKERFEELVKGVG